MKKQTKINNQIKKIFSGAGFDDGITRLESETLLELAMLLELNITQADDTDIIKSLRRIWSNGDMDERRIILNYLQNLNQTFDNVLHETNEDKEGKITTIIDALEETTHDEKEYLRTHFMEQRLKKISTSRMQRYLNRYRLQSKKESLAKASEGTFLEDGSFEFFHTFELRLQEESFNKIFVLHTDLLAYVDFGAHTYEELFERLAKAKSSEIEGFKVLLDNLINYLNRDDHPYLSFEERLTWLKALEPDSDLDAYALSFNLLQRIIKEHVVLHNLIVTKNAVHAIRKATYRLPDETPLHYTYELTLPLWQISAQIIKGEAIDLDEKLEALQSAQIEHFIINYEVLRSEIENEAVALGMPKDSADTYIALQLKEFFQSDRTLHISHKMHQKVVHNFMLYTADLRWQRQREALLARTIRDFKALFPVARSLKRKIIFHAGPTNSGKTYEAMQALKDADTGAYLAPLRLLALEGYENLKQYDIPVTLLTGEEEIFDEEAGHVSSTIEMADFETVIDVALIDEIQMIADRDRGWAWANALIGIAAKTVYLTGSLDAVEAVRYLCDWLGEELEVVEYQRKNRQVLLQHATPLNRIEPGTAVIAFSRADVLKLRQKLSSEYKVSVIYGNLSPEVRREEARRFREGESDVLVATDAIAMGLNLPIKTLLFSKSSKFDGEERRLLTPSEAQQIAGRAGRYGIEEVGYIGAIDNATIKQIASLIQEQLPELKPPFNVMANFGHIELVSSILQTQNLSEIMRFFAKHMQFDGPFKAANFESMEILGEIVDRYPLTLKERFTFATAPVGSAPLLMQAYEHYVQSFATTKKVSYQPMLDLPAFADTQERLREVEDKIKEISLYLWLAYRYEESFSDAELARSNRSELNRFIENSLQHGAFIKRCRSCGKALPMEYEFAICQSCFVAQKHQKRGSWAPKAAGYKRK